MSEPKQYLKKIKLPNNDIKYIRDEDAVHVDEIGGYLADYLPLTGGTVTGPVTFTTITASTITASTISASTITVGDLSVTNLDLGDIPEIITTISNVLTKDSNDNDKLKYHSTDNFLYEIGGIGLVTVNNDNTVVYTVGITTT